MADEIEGAVKNKSSFLSNFGSSLLSSVAGGALNLGFSSLSNWISNSQAQSNARYWANYNSPANQMARLKEAGLNPNLVYGNGADAQSSGNTSAPSNIYEGSKFLDIMSYKTMMADINYKKALTAKEEEERKGIELENQRKEASNPRAMGNLDFRKSTQDLINSRETRQNLISQTNLNYEQSANIQRKTNAELTQIYQDVDQKAKVFAEKIKYLPQELEIGINKLSAEVGLVENNARAVLIKAYKDAEVGNQLIELYKQQIENYKTDNTNQETKGRILVLEESIKNIQKGLADEGVFDYSDTLLNKYADIPVLNFFLSNMKNIRSFIGGSVSAGFKFSE